MIDKECIACGKSGINVVEVLNLGVQAPANNLLNNQDDKDYKVYPLGIDACIDCGHGQLSYFVPPEELFSHYLYVSSTSQTMRDHMKKLAYFVLNLKGKDASVFELGSNDGLFLKSLKEVGINDAIGIDPAANIVSTANEEGLETILGYWPEDGKNVESNHYDIVIGQNVFAHTADPFSSLQEVKRILKDDGFAIFQTSQADMIANGEFDTTYHEHCSFFCESSMDALAKRVGLRLVYTHYVDMHGNSSLYVLVNDGTNSDITSIELSAVASGLDEIEAKDERTAKLRKTRTIADWDQFYQTANGKKSDASRVASDWVEKGYRVVSVGAAAKGITFLRSADIVVDSVLDEAPLKINKWIPGLDVQIAPFSSLTQNDAFIISAWNFAKEIAMKLIDNGADPASPCLLYFPEGIITTVGYLALNGIDFDE